MSLGRHPGFWNVYKRVEQGGYEWRNSSFYKGNKIDVGIPLLSWIKNILLVCVFIVLWDSLVLLPLEQEAAYKQI